MKKTIAIICFLIASIGAFSQEIAKWKITDIEKMMSSKDDEILVLNFWATFCKPCVAEIPGFINVVNKQKNTSVKLMLISLDLPAYYPAKIAAFAAQHHFDANISWLQETNADYFCPKIDTAWSGAIPATLILNKKTGYRFFIEGEMEAAVFKTELNKAINSH